mgnify:FL=1
MVVFYAYVLKDKDSDEIARHLKVISYIEDLGHKIEKYVFIFNADSVVDSHDNILDPRDVLNRLKKFI